jgi:hypothetical protein
MPRPGVPGRGAWAYRSPARQSSSPTTPGKAPRRDPGDQLASPGPALHTVSPPDGHRQQCPSGRGRHGPSMACLYVGHGPAHDGDTQGIKTAAGCRQSAPRCSRPSAETQPRCGGTLGGGMRRRGTLVPRMRQAPDGGKEGGSQPTESSVINRRVFLAPALPIDQRKNDDADVKKLLPTLDI